MKRQFLTFCILCLVSTQVNEVFAQKKCSLSVELVGRSEKNIFLIDPFFVGNFEELTSNKINIKDGKFNYDFEFSDVMAHVILIEDEWGHREDSYTFFPIEGAIEIKLHEEEKHWDNSFVGGNDNKLFAKYRKEINEVFEEKYKPIYNFQDSLDEIGLYYSDTMTTIYSLMKTNKNKEEQQKYYEIRDALKEANLDLSEQAKESMKKLKKIIVQHSNARAKYIAENPSITMYYVLIKELKKAQRKKDVDRIASLKEILHIYSERYPEHPYTAMGKSIFSIEEMTAIGGGYYDFNLADSNGKEYIFSELIKGKIALLNIWAPWCGSCIIKSRRLKPLYEKYKDDGFIVVGVASKHTNLQRVHQILTKETHPWLTLIDAPEANSGINAAYGSTYSGGTTVLIDKEGKILAVSPSIEEIKSILENNASSGD